LDESKQLSVAERLLGTDWDTLWRGCGSAWAGAFRLIWVLVRFFLARLLWGTAIRLAHFASWTRTLGLVLALFCIVLIGWTLLGLRRAVVVLGLKRLAIILALVFVAIVAFNLITVPDDRPFPARMLARLQGAILSIGRAGIGLVQSVIRSPGDLLFAYTGQRRPPRLPAGFPTPDPDATPIQAILAPHQATPARVPTLAPQPTMTPLYSVTTPATVPPTNMADRLHVGGYAIVVGTDDKPLRARAGPGTGFEILTRFPEGTRLLVLDGPESGEQYTWWRVRGDKGEGWCADRWLAPTN
jgi:hypothetical protein